MTNTNEMVHREAPAPGAMALSVGDVIAQTTLIQNVMKSVMKEGPNGHYGRIPGCGDKPALFKAGAEKLAFTFRLAPSFSVERVDLPGGHREYHVVCTLTHITSGAVLGQGVGSCSSMEAKYRYRGGARKCPECGKETIKKSKYPPRGAPRDTPPGFYCFAKIGGCGVEFAHDDPKIVDQADGRAENPDIADTYNTVLKMAKKRAQVDATLTATAASDIFTQDIDELEVAASHHPAPSEPPAPPRARAPRTLDQLADRVSEAQTPPDDDVQVGGDPIDEVAVRGMLKDLAAPDVKGDITRALARADGEGKPFPKGTKPSVWPWEEVGRLYAMVFAGAPTT